MPEIPSPHAIGALVLTVATFALFAMGRVRIELICLGLIATLALGFYFFPFEQAGRFSGMEVAFGGFSHEALVAICCLMVLGRGLLATGALEPLARSLTRLWRYNTSLGLLCSILLCLGISLFVNDTPVLVLTLPILLAISARAARPLSKTLMPVNCAILIGGMATTIGTSTNLLVVSIARDLGQPQIGIFDFTPIVLIAAAVALPYLWLIMPRLLPAIDTTTRASKRIYDAALHVDTASRALRKGIAEVGRMLGPDVHLFGVVRHGKVYRVQDRTIRIAPGDRILVGGTREDLRESSDMLRTPMNERGTIDRLRVFAASDSQPQRMAELAIGAGSRLIGTDASDIAHRYGVAVLGAARPDRPPFRGMDQRSEALNVGDVLLVQGTPDRLVSLELGEGALLLEGGIELPHNSKAPLAILIVCGVVALSALRIVPIAIAALAGTLAMFASRCVRLDSIGQALKLEVIVLVAASIALGRALVETGAAEWLATLFALGLGDLPPAALLACLMAFMAALTNFVSNAAAAAVGTPIAVSLAAALGVNAEPYVLAVLFGCNLCYATPMAYQTNLLIMSAARYQFRDFVRAGLPLVVIMICVLAYLLVGEYSL